VSIHSKKVILFPKWREMLKQKSLQALEEQRFQDALQMLNQLLEYGVKTHEIVFGKLICLIELGEYEDAQQYCETLLTHKHDHYIQYIYTYIIILFQTNQYQLLIDQASEVLEERLLPHDMHQHVQQLYFLSKQKKIEDEEGKVNKHLNELKEAVKQKDYLKQWHHVNALCKLKIEPAKINHYLTVKHVHPVVKTAILKWLQAMNVRDNVKIFKLGEELTVRPIDVTSIQEYMRSVLVYLENLEQKDPTLFNMLKTTLHRYMYVKFPIIHENMKEVATALTFIGHAHMYDADDFQINKSIEKYIYDIKKCEALYLSIIEDEV